MRAKLYWIKYFIWKLSWKSYLSFFLLWKALLKYSKEYKARKYVQHNEVCFAPQYASLFYRTTFSLRKYFIVQFILVQQTNSFLHRRFICEAHVKREMIFCQNEDKFGLIVGERKWPSQVLFRQREILGKGEMKNGGSSKLVLVFSCLFC